MNKDKLLYDSFNARYLGYEEIANLFIANRQYTELIKTNHSLLMGPRGSGKTTLLKMLTIPAQRFWKRKNENTNLTKPSFFAVYIPTDVQWKKQLDEFEKEFQHKKRYTQVVSRLVVTTNILISLCDTFLNILDYEVNESDLLKEADFSKTLIADWKITKPVGTNLNSIKHSLLNRVSTINSHIKKVRALDTPENEIDYPDYFFDEYLPLVVTACNSFELTYKSSPSFKDTIFKWALCFDELEIAPPWLQAELLSLLRSTSNQNILFKLTMVPLVLIDSKKEFADIQAREHQDFSIIRTWTFNQDSNKDWVDFSRRLIQDKFKRSFNSRINPLGVFGPDNLDINIIETYKSEYNFSEKKNFNEGSPGWVAFKELASTDKSFRDFLKSKEINASNPIPGKNSQKDEVFRKVKPIVVHRLQFRSHVIIGRKRSRKNPALYYGLPFLCDFCDGNPRALIGLIDEFIGIMKRLEEGQRIHISIQSRIIYNASRKYLESIYNHPDSNVPYLNKYINLGGLLDKIGKYFKDKLIADDFKMDPVNCFVVDSATPEQIIKLLTVGMKLGAIIYLDPQESISKQGLIGKRFRLSYFLFPHYQIPTVTYQEIQLSKILKRGTDKIDQLLLFDTK